MEQQHIDTIGKALYYARFNSETYYNSWSGDASEAECLDRIDAALEALRAHTPQPARVEDSERQLSTPHWVAASANDLGAIEAMLAGVNNPANHAHVRLWLDRAWQVTQHNAAPDAAKE